VLLHFECAGQRLGAGESGNTGTRGTATPLGNARGSGDSVEHVSSTSSEGIAPFAQLLGRLPLMPGRDRSPLSSLLKAVPQM